MTPSALILFLIAGFALLAAINVQSGWLFLVGYSLLALVLASALLGSFRLKSIALKVQAPEQSEAGGKAPLSLWLTAPRKNFLIACLLPPVGRKPRRRFFFSELVPAGWAYGLAEVLAPQATVLVEVDTPRRGEYPLPPVVLAAAPLGMWTSTRTFHPEGTLLVLPRIHRLLALPWLRFYRGEGDGAPRPQVGGELFRTIREYQSGDSMRQIHWKSTAKRGALMVKETDTDQGFTSVRIALDPVGDPEVVEQVFSVAASLVAHLHRRGIQPSLYSSSGQAPDDLAGQLRWLALHPAGGTSPQAEDAVLFTGRTNQNNASFVIQCGPGEGSLLGLLCPPGADVSRVLGGDA
ncbi:MAG: DUF58 domain-containing protein [Bacteroidota bacterium]